MRRVLLYSHIGNTNYNINSVGTLLIATADSTPTGSPTFAGGTKAGINLGLNLELNVSVPVATRTVSATDKGRILVLRSTLNPQSNSGCFLITDFDTGSNSYKVDYRSGTRITPDTTIAATSNNVSLPQATINVASTTVFPAGPGATILVFTDNGVQTVTYTAKTATTFTGCTGGTGTIRTGNGVANNATTLPQATLTVPSTANFPTSGNIFVFTSTGRQLVTYTGTTATTFTGCTGGTGVIGFAPIVFTNNTTIAAGSNGVTFANTTITSGSNGATLPQGTINVVSTTGFPGSGTLSMVSTAGVQVITYTGTSGGNQFTGCTGGTGTLSTGNAVFSPTVINVASTTTATTTVAVASNNVSLPTGTINVGTTAGFATVGSIYVTTSTGKQLVSYTGTTGTTFTGCTGGTGLMSTSNAVVAGFNPNGGAIYVATGAGVQPVTYTATTGTSFTGCLSVGTGTMSTGGVVYYSQSLPPAEPTDSMNWYLYEKDASVPIQGASNGNSAIQYRGNGTSTTPRVILQSPHAVGWQVRVCHETTNDSGVGTSPVSSECALITFAPGFSGDASGDFPVGGPVLHAPLYYNSNSNNLQGGALGFGDNVNIPTGTADITYRITMVGDDDGYGITIFGRRPGNASSPRSYNLSFGLPATEVLPPPPNNEARLFVIGSGSSTNSGNNLNDVSWYPGNIVGLASQGITIRSAYQSLGVPVSINVSLITYVQGVGQTGSPIFDGSAAESPWLGGSELMPVDVISGIVQTWNGSAVANFGFPNLEGRFLGTIPHIREGRANFAEYATTTDLFAQHMRRGMWLLWGGPPVVA
jgi:hypothetical protein